MSSSRRMKRMSRKQKPVALSLTSLMDVFTNLLFFLLLSQGATTIDAPPKEIKLPDSMVEEQARPSVTLLVSAETIAVQGEVLAMTPEVLAQPQELIVPIRDRLALIKGTSIGVGEANKDGHEVTILADSEIPFKVLKRLMMTCTIAGYNKISLAVTQNSGVTAPPPHN